MTREEAITTIRISGLSEHTDYLVSLIRPSAKIQLHQSSGTCGADLRRSFFGGLPLLPKGFEWPLWDRRERLQANIERWEKRINPAPQYQWMQKAVEDWKQHLNDGPMPLAFLGQVFLGELASSIALEDWPTNGSLAFFYGDSAMPGYSSANRGHCRVIYLPEEAALHLTDFPKALGDEFRYPRLHASFHLEWTLPGEPLDEGSDPFLRRNLEYRQLLGRLMSWHTPPGQAPHRCAGYPQQIEGAMEDECQLTAERISWAEYRAFNSDQQAQLRQRGRDWQMLAQFASDERLGWMWSDVGLVYFWAHRDDIAKLNFDGALAILESG
jgi:uncharacterized protein YwqG